MADIQKILYFTVCQPVEIFKTTAIAVFKYFSPLILVLKELDHDNS